MDQSRRLAGFIVPRATLIGLTLAIPFLALNAIVSRPVQLLVIILRTEGHTTPLEYALLATVLPLLPAGALVGLAPAWLPVEGVRRYPAVNVTVAAILVTGFILVTLTLGAEIYRCDVLDIPNCD